MAAAVALVIVALAAAVVVIAPGAIRRRKRLVPADQRFAPAVRVIARMAVDDGVRPPGVLISPAPKGEPFSFGRPGDYRIALPRKLALTSGSDLFRALVGHELAHLVHRGVALSWMARSQWFVLGPALAVPVLITVLHGDPLLALDVLWRSAMLMAVVLLVVRARAVGAPGGVGGRRARRRGDHRPRTTQHVQNQRPDAVVEAIGQAIARS